MVARLRAMQARHAEIGDIRGRGAMIAMELVAAGHHRTGPRAHRSSSRRPATPQGVVVLTAGTYGNVLRFLPPLVIAAAPAVRGPRRAGAGRWIPWPRDPSRVEAGSTGCRVEGETCHGCDEGTDLAGARRGAEGPADRREVDRDREDAAPSTIRPPARCSPRSPTPPRRTASRPSTPPSPPPPTGPRPTRASAARSCAAPSICCIERADDIALLMTLEMGKPLAEARGEVTYGAEFFRWFSEEAVRIAGRYSVAPSGGTRLLTMKQPVGPGLRDHPVELPAGDGHPQDRPRARRRLHRRDQAGGRRPR